MDKYLLTPDKIADSIFIFARSRYDKGQTYSEKEKNRIIAKAQLAHIADKMLEHVKAEPDLPPRWVADMIADLKREVNYGTSNKS